MVVSSVCETMWNPFDRFRNKYPTHLPRHNLAMMQPSIKGRTKIMQDFFKNTQDSLRWPTDIFVLNSRQILARCVLLGPITCNDAPRQMNVHIKGWDDWQNVTIPKQSLLSGIKYFLEYEYCVPISFTDEAHIWISCEDLKKICKSFSRSQPVKFGVVWPCKQSSGTQLFALAALLVQFSLV